MPRHNPALIALIAVAFVAGIASILVAVLVRPLPKKRAGPVAMKPIDGTTKAAKTAKADTLKPSTSPLERMVASRSFRLGTAQQLGTLSSAKPGSEGSDPFVLTFGATSKRPSATGFEWDDHAEMTPSPKLIARLSKLSSEFELRPVAVGRLFAKVDDTETNTRILAAERSTGKASAAESVVKLGNSLSSSGAAIESNTVVLLSVHDNTSFFTKSVYVFMLDPTGSGGYFLTNAAAGTPLVWGPRVDATYTGAQVPAKTLYLTMS